MSNFLHNLVAMNSGAAPSVRPYVPSPFEPSAQQNSPPVGERFKTSAPQGLAHPEHTIGLQSVPQPTAPSAHLQPAPRIPPQRAMPIEHHPEATGAVEIQQAPPDAAGVLPALTPQSDRPQKRIAAFASVPELSGVVRVSERPSFNEKVVPTRNQPDPPPQLEPVVLTPPALTLLVTDPRLDPPIPPDRSGLSIRPRSAGQSSFEPGSHVLGDSARNASPSIANPRRPMDSYRQLSQERAALSEPDIHVTIGRVEIRATSPGPQPIARRTAPQHMTLEEYQRRRNAGGGQ